MQQQSQSKLAQDPPEYHQFVIIGGGISGLQSALILAQRNHDFVLLEASGVLGGRIKTQKLSEVIQKQNIAKQQWITPQMLAESVETGATWICKEHSYMLNMAQKYQISIFPQYSDGLSIYGINKGKYEKIESFKDYFKKYKKQISILLTKIESLTLILEDLSNANDSTAQKKMLEEFIEYYDNMAVPEFIRNEISNQELGDLIMNQMEALQCISCDNFSVLQLINDSSCMELLRLYCDMAEDNIDGLRVKSGMITFINKMKENLDEILSEKYSECNLSDIIRLNSPVLQIQNDIGEDVIVKLKNGKKISCMKVLFTVPIAVANQIKISKISPGKKMIFANQESGQITRFYFVFSEAFWRNRYSGSGTFSKKFPFNELADISPSSLSCGIFAFIFVGNRLQMWEEKLKQENPTLKDIKPLLIKYMLICIADMFLDGNLDAPQLKHYFTYTRAFKSFPYLKAGYQATTKPQIWRKVTQIGDDYKDCYSRNQYNIIYLGSQVSESKQYGTFMQGAIRITRKKLFEYLGQEDPLKYLHHKVIQW